MFSAHSRAGKSWLFSKRTSQSSGSSARTTRNDASSSRTASLPSTCGFSIVDLESDLDLAVLGHHLVAAHLDVREGEASTGRHVVLEAVPGAGYDLALVVPPELPVVLLARDQRSRRRLPFTQGTGLVRADVRQAVELAPEVEDPDLPPADLHHPVAALGELRDIPHHVLCALLGHLSSPLSSSSRARGSGAFPGRRS